MGALRRLRARQVLYAAGVTALLGPAVMMLTGCEPGVGGLDSVIVAVTTDQRATARLQQEGYYVQWLTCIGTAEQGGTTDKGSPRPVTAVGVDCEGRTGGNQKIIVYGRVTGIHGQSCVRGRLTAKVDGKTAFTASVLGECSGEGVTGGGDSKPDQPPKSQTPPKTQKPGDHDSPAKPGRTTRPPTGPSPSPDCTDKPADKPADKATDKPGGK
ncbi:hypothetical protein [Streptomyces sp. ISL-11]|uniref:hypothetical protein n=1 Tax=Streptomyces sp. ISL-11 TaxID=2819174 RepID=UPI001BE79FAD|nr:hypothetical protein [Streptomyces sp. ISL-11]MBT2383514.1 hypothetical protein [Streptomyces sp. ISL-11]